VQTLWFILVAVMIGIYVVLDGFDLGVGALHLVIARTPAERRVIRRTIGPVWDANEVWLLAGGGALFFAFPLLYSAGFSGFYLPLFMVLWLLILRAIALEFGSHINHEMWTQFWDVVFSGASAVLAIFFGAALANVVRGVPLDKTHSFFEPLWSTFDPRSAHPGILDWYTVLIAVLALCTIGMHGANYLALKTDGNICDRARGAARVMWPATIVLTALAAIATRYVRDNMFDNFKTYPWGVILPMLAIGGLVGMGFALARKRDDIALLSSTAYILGMLTSTVLALYPLVLPARNALYNLTIHNASTSEYGLEVGLRWWLVGMVLAAIYFVTVYRLFRSKVHLTDVSQLQPYRG
jgi:cytochrome d ubiquinol oxidase subunit II